MKKVFDLYGVVLCLTLGVETSNFLQELDGVFVPAIKSLDDERLKGDALGPAVVEGAVFGGLPHRNSNKKLRNKVATIRTRDRVQNGRDQIR